MTGPMVRLAAVVSVLGITAPAAADDWSLHVTGNAQLGWTDNVFSAPEDPPVGGVGRESDFYTQLVPGALFTWEARRWIQEADYSVDATLYADHSEAHALNHRLAWRGFFLTSPLTELTISAEASQGTTTTFSTATTAANGDITLLPSGRSDFEGFDLRQGFNWQTTHDTRVTQSSQARVFGVEETATGATSTGYEAGVGIGGEKAWRTNALALAQTASFVRLNHADALGMASSFDQILGLTTLSWRRDLSRHWSSLLDVGAATIVPLIKPSATIVQPTIGGALSYAPDWGTASLQVRRTIAPNLYVAQNTLSDTASLSGWLPLPWLTGDAHEPHLTIQATLGVGRTQILDAETNDTVSSFDVGTADVAVGYQLASQLVLGARYQYVVQSPDDAGMSGILGYSRHTVLVTFTGRWPSRAAGGIPVRSPLRVDRANDTLVGDEPGGTP